MNKYTLAKRVIASLLETDADDYLIRQGIASKPKPLPLPPEPTPWEKHLVTKGSAEDFTQAEPQDIDADEILQKYLEQEGIRRFEGPSGVMNLENVCEAIGYSDLNEFLEDNPGACEAIIEFIEDWVPRTKNHPDGWYANLLSRLDEFRGDED